MKCICIRCGKEFEAKHKTAVCSDCHTAVCVVCGKTFDLQMKHGWLPVYDCGQFVFDYTF